MRHQHDVREIECWLHSIGYQKEDTILLSPDATADAIPDLEIDNSDVKCSQGATIGKIDDDKLFYLCIIRKKLREYCFLKIKWKEVKSVSQYSVF